MFQTWNGELYGCDVAKGDIALMSSHTYGSPEDKVFLIAVVAAKMSAAGGRVGTRGSLCKTRHCRQLSPDIA
jgi:hypothetical protein